MSQTPLLSNNNKPTFQNTRWILHRRPNGSFCHENDFKLIQETIDTTQLEDDEVIVQSEMLSCDAFIRTMLDDKAYHGSIDIGDTIPAVGYGKVVAAGSKSKHKVGSTVAGMVTASQYTKQKASGFLPMMTFPFMKPSDGLGLMGLTTGLTAYTGIFYVTKRPRKGETVVITASAGAVGSIAAQLAKSTGARVIGVAGGESKCQFLRKDLQLDDAIDYKCTKKTLEEQIEETCPDGIDFIYDNVGGHTLDALLDKINPNGRVVICGAISQYEGNLNVGKVHGPSNYLKLAEQGAEMKGFNVMQYMKKLPFALLGMFWMHMRGQVRMIEQVENGIEAFPRSLHNLFNGGHIGKMLVNVGNNVENKVLN